MKVKGKCFDGLTVSALDADNPSVYAFNCTQNGVFGTRVPLSTPTGGILKSKKLFGHVVAGDQIRSRMPLKPLRYYPKWLLTLQRDFEKTRAKAVKQRRKSWERITQSTGLEFPRDPDLGDIILAVQNQRQAEIALRASKEPWIQALLQLHSDVMRSDPDPKLPL